MCLFELDVLQLMDKECYKDIEKIKTIGSTYMAAVGLVPTIGTKVEWYFGSMLLMNLVITDTKQLLCFCSLGQKICLRPS